MFLGFFQKLDLRLSILSSFLNKTLTEMKNVLFVVVAIPKTFDGVKLWVRNQPFSL
jgi:hypothetical protein